MYNIAFDQPIHAVLCPFLIYSMLSGSVKVFKRFPGFWEITHKHYNLHICDGTLRSHLHTCIHEGIKE